MDSCDLNPESLQILLKSSKLSCYQRVRMQLVQMAIFEEKEGYRGYSQRFSSSKKKMEATASL